MTHKHLFDITVEPLCERCHAPISTILEEVNREHLKLIAQRDLAQALLREFLHIYDMVGYDRAFDSLHDRIIDFVGKE